MLSATGGPKRLLFSQARDLLSRRGFVPPLRSRLQGQSRKQLLHTFSLKGAIAYAADQAATVQAESEAPMSLPFTRFQAGCRALVLDSSYRPIDVINWQRAICLDLFDKVEVLEYYDMYVRSACTQFMVPAVLRIRCYVQKNYRGARCSLSRRNIMLRDKFTCQYCGVRSNLTVDHVKPMSKGGAWEWENLVTACLSCNSKKGDKTLRTLGWKLRKQPVEPSPYQLSVMVGMRTSDMYSPPKEWKGYLFPGQLESMDPMAMTAL